MNCEKAFDVVALGELLIDFIESGLSQQGNPLFEANPGGAPCNVLSMLARFGRKTAFIGKVGQDGFGQMLGRTIVEQGISDLGLKYDAHVHTTLALVQKLANGDRDFAFYRKPGADMNLGPEEVDAQLIQSARIFHFGSLSMTDEPVRSATLRALDIARQNHLLVSFDPNLRPPLWSSLDAAREQIDCGMRQTDILKIADNEIQWFTGKQDYNAGVRVLQAGYPNLKLICLSLGPGGSRAYWRDLCVQVPAFLQAGTIETTGAGDTFCACVLNSVLEDGMDRFDAESLKKMLIRANAAASIVTTRKGALKVMPGADEIRRFIASRQ